MAFAISFVFKYMFLYIILPLILWQIRWVRELLKSRDFRAFVCLCLTPFMIWSAVKRPYFAIDLIWDDAHVIVLYIVSIVIKVSIPYIVLLLLPRITGIDKMEGESDIRKSYREFVKGFKKAIKEDQ